MSLRYGLSLQCRPQHVNNRRRPGSNRPDRSPAVCWAARRCLDAGRVTFDASLAHRPYRWWQCCDSSQVIFRATDQRVCVEAGCGSVMEALDRRLNSYRRQVNSSSFMRMAVNDDDDLGSLDLSVDECGIDIGGDDQKLPSTIAGSRRR